MHHLSTTSHLFGATALALTVASVGSGCTMPTHEPSMPQQTDRPVPPAASPGSRAPAHRHDPDPGHRAGALEGVWRADFSRQDLGFAPSGGPTPNTSGLSEGPEWRMLVFHRLRLTVVAGHGSSRSTGEQMAFAVNGSTLTIRSGSRTFRVRWDISMDGLTLSPVLDEAMPPAMFVLEPFAHVHG
ncbi:hypothetical protein DEJ28_08755 [Curtobacterium sp. MCPF17_002]|uniref:hypothetical protein n=1 Tax=Curtobacterium sp. MCPF17_002 TaxID=2175645 RepID=UPI000DA8D0F5|nr:hypothetical protein [Curtobacterium sp. MCPF17_002]WIB79174.1 hypothetical protein DEJ28_08755 [Curtobacterium sp. MCPF17_002]